MAAAAAPTVTWDEDGQAQLAQWRTSGAARSPQHVQVVSDELRADDALRRAAHGQAMLWRGDFVNARQLLDAMKRRLDRKTPGTGRDPADTFYRLRQATAHRARMLAQVLVELGPDYVIALLRAPDVATACAQAYGPATQRSVVSLQELLGVIGAAQWRRRGVELPALGVRVHPHYGVFAPTRNEYLDLAMDAPMADTAVAFDIGTGTGVLALLLLRRGAGRVVATDIEARAVACAADNAQRWGLAERIETVQTDLFPPGRADLVVCNPPWLPATPTSSLDSAVYDRGGRMLSHFVAGLGEHLTEQGEGWLILSDLAELFGLRTRTELTEMFTRAGLSVRQRLQTRARHPGLGRGHDPLAALRAAETTTLWRLAVG